VGHGVEVEIDEGAVVESTPGCMADEGLLETTDMEIVEAIGIGGHGSALGEGGEAREETDHGIEGVVADMGIAFGA